MLRDYQQDLYQKTVAAFRAGHRRPLIVAPCGAGKSYIFAEMIRNTNGEALVLTHRRELKEQHEQLLRDLAITNARVAMVLTEASRLGRYPTPALVVADEAHLSRSNSWMKVIQHYDTWTVGLSATPVRMDGRPLGDVFDTLVEGVDTRWLIDHQRLAPYEYYAPTRINTEGLRTLAGDFVTADLEQLMTERAIYGDIVAAYRRIAPGERGIAYCVSVRHADEMASAFRAAGIRAESLSAGTVPKRRREVMEDFRRGEFDILCNVGIIAEGVSIDEVSVVLLARPTLSTALGIQMMMRCMRYMPGKTAKILDFVENYISVGTPDEERIWSLGEPLKRRPRTDGNGDFYIRACPECYLTFKTAPICPYCGAAYPLTPREIKAHQDIEIARITAEELERVAEAKRKSRMEQGRAATFEELIALGRERGYKNPAFWASKVMRGRKR